MATGIPTKGASGWYRYHLKGSAEKKDNYIGESKDMYNRYYQHLNNSDSKSDPDSMYIDEAIKKYGIDAFDFEWYLIPGSTKVQRLTIEHDMISYFNSYYDGYNRNKSSAKAYGEIKAYGGHIISWDLFNKIRFMDPFKPIDFKGATILVNGNINPDIITCLEMMFDCKDKITIIEQEFIQDKKGNWVVDAKKNEEDMRFMKDKKFDIIISNPPYGPTGRKITKMIIDHIDYEVFVNIMPVRDYIKGPLYQYVDIDSIVSIPNAFKDADTITHLAKIKKHKNNYIDKDEFTIETYEDKSLVTYFYGNSKREHYAIDDLGNWKRGMTFEEVFDIDKSIIIGFRDVSHKHMPYSKNVDSYKWNVEKSIDAKYMKDNHWNATGNFGKGQISYHALVFKTSIEKDNFAKFFYSDDGFRFMSKVFTAINTDGSVGRLGMPKVDWTKEWTVEKILKDYGYTPKEIKEVMDDLKNFKGMNA